MTGLKQLFVEPHSLPLAAREAYVYLPIPPSSPPERRTAWEKALVPTGYLHDAVAAFKLLTEQDPSDLAAWYNLGLSAAWLGDNNAAVAGPGQIRRPGNGRGPGQQRLEPGRVAPLRPGHGRPGRHRGKHSHFRHQATSIRS